MKASPSSDIFIEILRRNKAYIFALIALMILFAILEDLFTGNILHMDGIAYNLFVVKLRRRWLTPYMEQFSDLASPVILGVFCLIVISLTSGERLGRCILINLVCAVALNFILKDIIRRPRPEGFRLISEVGFSFPSGHSMVAMAFFGLIVWIIWVYQKNRALKYISCALLCFVIAMVGISRIYLGVHYASDVVSGFCISLLWLVFYTHTITPYYMGTHVTHAFNKEAQPKHMKA